MDDPLQDLRVADLATFLAVHYAKSVSAAARVLGVTPSQVSKAVARLEHALNVELLVRGPRGIDVSDAGKVFVPKLEELLARLQGLRGAEVQTQPELTLAAPSFLHVPFAPAIATGLSDYRLRLLSMPQILARAYASERMFLAAITVGKERFPERWDEVQLGPLHNGLFASPSTAAKIGREVPLSALGDVPFICPIYVVNGHVVPADDGCPLARDRRRVGQEVETIALGLDLAAHGDQVVYGPNIAARPYLNDGRLVEIVVEEWAARSPEMLYLYCDSNQMLARVQRILVERCVAVLGGA